MSPRWMPTSFALMAAVTGPVEPSAITMSPELLLILPIEATRAAVPQANASFSLPLAAFFHGFGLGEQAPRIIATAFGGARAALGRAGVAVGQPHGHRLLAAFEIGADGASDEDVQIFAGWADAEEGF